MVIPALKTDRLILRGFKETDVNPYIQMCADPEIMQYLSSGKTLSPNEAWKSLAFVIGHWTLRGFGLWAVEEKSTGEFVGRVGLLQPKGWPGTEVAWTLVKSAWGKGYATEAAKASLQWGFTHTNATELISLIIPENIASIKVSERIGQSFKKEIIIFDKTVNLYSINKDQAI